MNFNWIVDSKTGKHILHAPNGGWLGEVIDRGNYFACHAPLACLKAKTITGGKRKVESFLLTKRSHLLS